MTDYCICYFRRQWFRLTEGTNAVVVTWVHCISYFSEGHILCVIGAYLVSIIVIIVLQLSLSDSNINGLISLDDSDSFLSPFKVLLVDPENKYLRICFFFKHSFIG